MDDTTPAPESNEQGLNKIDLSQLQSFTFGTQWTEVKADPSSPRRDREDRGDRRDRRDEPGRGEPQARDRRGFRKPAGAPGSTPAGAPAGAGEQRPPFQGERRSYDQGGGGDRRDFGRGPGPSGGPGYQGGPGGPRRDFRGGGDFRGGDRRDYGRGEGDGQMERGPYISPYFTITCYPEDAGFTAIVKAIRSSCRTYQLFEITKAVLEKNDRFVAVIQRKVPETAARPAAAPASEGGEGPGEAARPAAKLAPMYMSMPDHLPFDTEEAAIQHVMKNHLGQFFETHDVEIEAPKGNFPIINKCGVTGELLGPPNHHKYQQVLQQHHATKLARMSFERFRESITSVREPEVVQAWLDKMKKATRYTWKPITAKPAGAPAATEAATEKPVEDTAAAPAPVSETPAAEPVAPVETPAEAPAATPAPEVVPAGPSFDSLEEARAYLLTNAKEKVVRSFDNVRFHGKSIELLPQGEIRRAVEGHIERQRRFPLDTANALRGRLRREGFTIFKKGSRGVSFVCAVKRRFRVPGQVFSESITGLIGHIEQHPMVQMKELPGKFLGIDLAALVAPPAAEGAPAPSPLASLPADQAEKLRKMNNDLRWLVTEGYVTEFSDGKLYAPPPIIPQAGKKADEHAEEHDPIDFPEAPAPEATAPAAQARVAEPAPAEEIPVPVGQTPAEEVSAPAEAIPENSIVEAATAVMPAQAEVAGVAPAGVTQDQPAAEAPATEAPAPAALVVEAAPAEAAPAAEAPPAPASEEPKPEGQA